MKACGVPEEEMKTSLKYKFIENQNILNSANAQGRSHMNDIKQQFIDIKSLIDTFTQKPGNEIFKPYFNNIEKYETEIDIDKELVFLDIAKQALLMYREIKNDAAKKLDNDVLKCVTFVTSIINEIPMSSTTP